MPDADRPAKVAHVFGPLTREQFLELVKAPYGKARQQAYSFQLNDRKAELIGGVLARLYVVRAQMIVDEGFMACEAEELVDDLLWALHSAGLLVEGVVLE